MKHSFVALACLIFPLVGSEGAQSTWNFSNPGDRFAASSGGAALGYYDPNLNGWGPGATAFGSASSLGLPLIGGADTQVMSFPACAPDQGYRVTHGFAPNGTFGDTLGLVSNYTVVMDVLFPAASDGAWRSLVQTDAANATDGDLFVQNTAGGGIGINGNYRGSIRPDTWHRIVWVMRAATGEGQAHRYLDGQFVGAIGTTGSGLAERFALGPDFLLFADENNDTSAGYVSSISILDRKLSYAEVVALGGPNAAGTGVPGVAAPPYAQRMTRPVGALGHRGSSGCAPENTLAAIDRAFLDGAAGTEIDTRLTADGVVVVFHDATVDRTTDGTGNVASMTVAQLKALDAGSWFSSDFVGERIPTLAEALTAAKGKGILYLDIKTGGQATGFAAAVSASGFPVEDLWFWTPGNAAYAAEIRAAIPGAVIVWGAPDASWRTDPNYFANLRAIGVAGFSYGFGGADLAFSARAKDEGMFVEVFTLLDPANIIAAAAAGVDYMETDFPNVMQALQPAQLSAASGPSPANGAMGVPGSPVLRWIPGTGATAHRVHFGTANPPPFVREQGSDLFQTPTLAAGGNYFWRIDEVTPGGTVAGPVWSFTTPAAPPQGLVNEWHLDGDLGASGGDSILSFAGGAATGNLVAFQTSNGTTVPHMANGPSSYLRVPAFTNAALGLDLTFTSIGPNGGGAEINRYTFVFDVLVPGPLNWMPFFNTAPGNGNDSDFFVRADGAIGISALGYAPAGSFLAGRWHRVIFSADLAAGIVTYYLDGTLVLQRTGAALTDGRFSLFDNLHAGPHVRLFNDNDGETLEVLVGAIAFLDQPITAATALELGAPDANGIFIRNAPTAITGVSVDPGTNNVTIMWTAVSGRLYAVDVSDNLVTWEELTDNVIGVGGAASFTEMAVNPALHPTRHYRVRDL